MEEIRSWFEVPTIAHYFRVFNHSFDLIDFDIEDFEEALVADGSENVATFLPEMFIRLLRGLYKTDSGLKVTNDNHMQFLQDLLNHQYGEEENPMLGMSSLQEVPMRTKVEILYNMTNWRMELQDTSKLTKNVDLKEMRINPVGKDSEGNVYWYFCGTRLYRERTTRGRKSKTSAHVHEEAGGTGWSLECSTHVEWESYMEQFRTSSSTLERKLYKSLEQLFQDLPESTVRTRGRNKFRNFCFL